MIVAGGGFAVALALAAAGIGGCASSTQNGPSMQDERVALTSYLRQVEPIRLAVNELLEGADPILSAYHDRRVSPKRASLQMNALERRFATLTLDITAIEPKGAKLRALHSLYAHTYILEDAYLSALSSGLKERDFDALPDTQSEQRAAIIQWRTGLSVLARRLGLHLPGDLQAAGRGEIAPSPEGS